MLRATTDVRLSLIDTEAAELPELDRELARDAGDVAREGGADDRGPPLNA